MVGVGTTEASALERCLRWEGGGPGDLMENVVAGIGEALIEVLTKGSSGHIKILKAKELFVELFEVVTGRPTANGSWPDELGRGEGGYGRGRYHSGGPYHGWT